MCVYIYTYDLKHVFVNKFWDTALHVFPHEKGETTNASN